jgi:integrase
VSKVPTFVRLGQGVSIGYRRNAGGSGVWIVRLADGKRGNNAKKIASADDLAPADGKTIMDYSQAAEAARRLAKGEPAEGKPVTVTTLGDALKTYSDDLATRGGGADNATRLKCHLTPAMLKRPVALFDTEELKRWRDGLARKKLAPASINRVITVMKAVLNLAAKTDATLDARAWRIGLETLPEATIARNTVLPAPAIADLVRAGHEQSPEFGLLVETLAVTGARVSQLARCQVRDLVDDRLMVPSSAKGQKKRATRTAVPIPASLAARLKAEATGRGASLGDLLFVKPAGTPWGRSDHVRPFDRAAIVAGINPKDPTPDDVTVYSLRHSHITAQLLASIPPGLVAKLHDTSVAMIEQHYAATIATHGADMVHDALVDFAPRPESDVVVPLRRPDTG